MPANTRELERAGSEDCQIEGLPVFGLRFNFAHLASATARFGVPAGALAAQRSRQRNIGAQVDGNEHPGDPLEREAEQEQPDYEKRLSHHAGDEDAAGHDHAEDGVGPCERGDPIAAGHADEDAGEEMPAVPAEVQAERGCDGLADPGRDQNPGGQRVPRAHEHGGLLLSREQDVGEEEPQGAEHGPTERGFQNRPFSHLAREPSGCDRCAAVDEHERIASRREQARPRRVLPGKAQVIEAREPHLRSRDVGEQP